MFVRCKTRHKDGKEHRYWSVVENVRVRGGRVVQRQVLYLGEINDSQRAAWCRTIEVLEGKSGSRQMALFPEGREAPALNCEVVRVQVQDVEVHAPRQWGACWLTLCLWERLELDRVLGSTLACKPTRHAMAGHREGAGLLPSHRPGERVATSPAVVRAQRVTRFAGMRSSPCQ